MLYSLDIETIPNPKMVALLPEIKADSRLKDPEKIKADIEKKKAEQVQKMALDPLYGQICSYAVCPPEGEPVGMTIDDTVREYELLESLLRYLDKSNNLVTWNGLGFDIPFIYKRAMLLDFDLNKMSVPVMGWWMKRYSTIPHCDLMQVWCNWYGRVSLNEVSTAILGEKKEEIDVAKFPEMIKTEEGREEILKYNKKDAVLPMNLHKKMTRYLF